MLIGNFEIPEKRLVPNTIEDTRIIYNTRKMEETKSGDVSALLGYKHPTSTRFYHRLNSMTSYGLMEGRGSFRITELGKSLLFPENEQHEKQSKNKAIMNIPLWNEFYKMYQKELPSQNLWVQIKNITGCEPDIAQKYELDIKKSYNEDIAQYTEGISKIGETQGNNITPQKKSPQQTHSNENSSLATLSVANIGTIEINDEDTLIIARSYLNVLEKIIQKEKEEAKKKNSELEQDL